MGDYTIAISMVAGKAMLFDLEDIKRARGLGIVGVLSGTLPAAPQQNMFLGVPLQLMSEECLWLIRSGYARLLPDDLMIRDIYTHLTEDDIVQLQLGAEDDLNAQKRVKVEQHEKKMAKLGMKKYRQDDKLISQGLSVTVHDTPSRLPNYELFKTIYKKSSRSQRYLINKIKIDELQYKIFSYLRSRGYFLAPGIRFGGKFIAYPGDPLRFHAHLIVNDVKWNDDIGLINIVGGGRLATGVKKLWVVASEPDSTEEEDIQCFSIEWAGFG